LKKHQASKDAKEQKGKPCIFRDRGNERKATTDQKSPGKGEEKRGNPRMKDQTEKKKKGTAKKKKGGRQKRGNDTKRSNVRTVTSKRMGGGEPKVIRRNQTTKPRNSKKKARKDTGEKRKTNEIQGGKTIKTLWEGQSEGSVIVKLKKR